MKTISVRWPWVELIRLGLKPLENRTWATPYRGPLQLHASKATSFQELADAYAFCLGRGLTEAEEVLARWIRRWLQTGWRPPDLQGIVARCDLTNCLCWDTGPEGWRTRTPRLMLDPWFEKHPTAPKSYGWVLDNVESLPFRPCVGKLGLFDVDYESLPMLAGQNDTEEEKPHA